MGARGPLPKINATVTRLPGSKPPPVLRLPATLPKPPTWLDREAAAEWRRIVPVLHERGLLASVDRTVLTLWCRVWSRWVKLDRLIEQQGEVVSGHRGVQAKNPALQVWRECGSQLTALGKELGTSPSARLRMVAPEGDGGGEGDDILD